MSSNSKKALHNRAGRARATIRDVAARAGVATSTVSRALSDPGRVHPATRERVLQAAREVDYRTSPRRRADVDLPASAIALLIPDVANPYYSEITRGTQMQSGSAGFLQVLADTEESAAVEEQALRQVARLADGVVLAATRLSDEQLRQVARVAPPLVLINRVIKGFSSVCLDTGLGVRQAVDHLMSLGHRRLAYLSGPAGSWSDEIRWGVIDEVAGGSDISAVRLGPFAPTFASGAAAADSALNTDATGLIAFNDVLAIGVMRRLNEREVDVPGAISVVGCDDIFGADVCTPPLTTISGDLQRVGRAAVQVLLAILDDPRRAPEAVTLPTHLTIRASTGAPPNAY